MSVRVIHASEIDPTKWDDLAAHSDNGSVCIEFWFIQHITGGNWWAHVLESDDGQWLAAIPAFLSKKMGNRFSRQPILSKYWGVMLRNGPTGDYQRLHTAKEHMAVLLQSAGAVSVFDYFSPIDPVYPPQYTWSGFELGVRFTCLLQLHDGMDALRKGYSRNVRKKVNRLQKEGFSNVLREDSADLEHMLVLNLNEGRKLIPANAIEPLKAMSAKAFELGKGFFMSTLSPYGEVAAAGFFLQNESYCHFISGYVNPKFRNQNAMNLLVDGALEKAADQSRIFDFFGSQIESIEAFFRSFGAYGAPYYRVVKTKFPFNLIWKA